MCFFVQTQSSFAQTNNSQEFRKISEMIASYQKLNGLYTDTFKLKVPKPEEYDKVETTILGAITFPNKVKVTYLAKKRGISKLRKDAVNKWWQDFGENSFKGVYYQHEILVKEGNITYWIMSDDYLVVRYFEEAIKKNEEVMLRLRILGYQRKGNKFDFFLMAESGKGI